MKQTKVLGFQVQIGNEHDGWFAFGAQRNTVRGANVLRDFAIRKFSTEDGADVRVIRITETREAIED